MGLLDFNKDFLSDKKDFEEYMDNILNEEDFEDNLDDILEKDFEELVSCILNKKDTELQIFLQKQNLTYEQALENIQLFRKHFLEQCQIYNIDITKKKTVIEYFQNHFIDEQNQWLFISILCDNGYLMDVERKFRSEEQDIYNGIMCMEEIEKVSKYFDFCRNNKNKFEKIISIIPNYVTPIYDENDEKEVEDIIQILETSWFYIEDGYIVEVLKNNLIEFLSTIRASELLLCIKPLFLFLLLRNHKNRITETEGIRYQTQKLFQYKKYKIDVDNGKNFKNYQEMILFFEKLCLYYQSDTNIDLDLCRYGFSATSNLAQWYYEQYLVEEDSMVIPCAINIIRNTEFRFNEELADIEYWELFETSYYKRIEKFLIQYIENNKKKLWEYLDADNQKLSKYLYETIIVPKGICAKIDKQEVITFIKHKLYAVSEEMTYEVLKKCLYQWIGI